MRNRDQGWSFKRDCTAYTREPMAKSIGTGRILKDCPLKLGGLRSSHCITLSHCNHLLCSQHCGLASIVSEIKHVHVDVILVLRYSIIL